MVACAISRTAAAHARKALGRAIGGKTGRAAEQSAVHVSRQRAMAGWQRISCTAGARGDIACIEAGACPPGLRHLGAAA